MLNGECCRNHHEIGNGLSIFFCLHLSADLWLVGCCLLYSGCSIPVPMLLFRECCSHHRIQPVDSIVLQLRVESLDRLQTWLADRRSSQYGPWSQGLHVCQPNLYVEALHVRKRFNSDHERRGRSKPGCQEVESSTIAHEERGRSKPGCREMGSSAIALLVTEANCQSSFHSEFMSTGDESNQMWCRDESHWDGWVKTSAWTGQSWWLFILHNILFTADLRCRFGGEC